jgi:hypothetical protein
MLKEDILGTLISRLVPGFDGYVRMRGDLPPIVVWNDARPQPTDAELEAEFQIYLSEQAAEQAANTDRDAASARFKALDVDSLVSITDVKEAIKDIQKLLF